jgi:hypothetical protein
VHMVQQEEQQQQARILPPVQRPKTH